MSRAPIRGCGDWHATRRAFLGRAAEVVPMPGRRPRRPGGVRARRAGSPGATCSSAASACWIGHQRARRPLDARRARGRRGPGRRRARRHDPRLALPRRRQRRAQHARPARRPALPRRCARASAIAPATTLPLAGHARASAGTRPWPGCTTLYDAGKVAVLPSVDFADADQSHFNSAGYWRSGIVGPSFESTGWLGRTLDVVGTHDNPLQGISVGWSPGPVADRRTAPPRRRSTTRATSTSTSRTSGQRGLLRGLPRRGRRRAPSRPAPGRRAAHVRQHLRGARPARAAARRTTATRSRRCRWPTPTPTSARASRNLGAPARRRLRHARRRALDRRLRHPRRRRPRRTPSCSRTSATRCAPGRPTSTRAGSRAASSRWSGASSAAAPRTTTRAAPTTAPAAW